MNSQTEGNSAIEAGVSDCSGHLEWIDKQLSEQDDLPALSLDERGMILDCNKPFELLFGLDWRDLVWHHVTKLFPQLTAEAFIHAGQAHPATDYLTRFSQLYQAQDRHGVTFFSNLIFVSIEREGDRFLRVIVFPAEGPAI